MKTNAEKFQTFLKLCSILLIAALALLFAYTQGFRINLSDSLPHRIYRISKITDKPITRGDYAVVDYSMITHHSAIEAALERKYLNRIPMLKQVGAIPGDVVTLRGNLIYINGKETGEMVVLSEDSLGNPFSAYPTPVTLQSVQYWLISNPERGFDSRYFGPVSRDCITHTAYPVW